MKKGIRFCYSPEELNGTGAYIYVECFLEMRAVRLLLDTGASTSYLCQSVFDRSRYFRHLAEILPEEDRLIITGIHGSEKVEDGWYLDKVNLKFKEGFVFPTSFHVANIELWGLDGLLGVDFFIENKISMDFHKKTMCHL